MKKVMALVFGLAMVLAGFGAAIAGEEDVKGCKDPALLSRMPNFRIGECKESQYDSYRFLDQNGKTIDVEGHKIVIRYYLNKGAAVPGQLMIRRNVEDALKKIGGKVVRDDNFNRVSVIMVQKDGNESWVEVRGGDDVYILTIVEKQGMKQEVTANAQVMNNDINSTGHVAIYGIYFDTGKAEIKPESDAAIAEIAKLLQNNSGLKVYVVGHTDSVGNFDSNMSLSKARADAVVRSLTGKGIAAARLKAYGVASLAPVASNDSEDGKAKNRRVELVKQ